MLLLNSANMAFNEKGRTSFTQHKNSLQRPLGYLIILFVWCKNVQGDCLVGQDPDKYDLQLIKRWNPWVIKSKLDPTKDVWSLFYINICNNTRATVAANHCSAESSSICLKTGTDYTNIGSFHPTYLNYTLSENNDGFRLDFRGDNCSASVAEKQEQIQTSINFKCGTTLGSPVFIGKLGCTYFFEWHSTVACKNARPDRDEVKCYLYDNKNQKRDLSPLVKTSGGYLVTNSDAGEDELYINVCRDITPEAIGPTSKCPVDAAACHLNSDKSLTGDDVGHAKKSLVWLNDKHLQLRYESDSSPTRCRGFKPRVTVAFVCPQEEGRISGGRDPVLLSSTNCQYDIEWQTEYACDAEILTVNTCHFNIDLHGIDIDLSPLTLPQTSTQVPYKAIDTVEDNVYYINVCNKLQHPCGDSPELKSTAAVCQAHGVIDPQNPKVAGVKSDMELRYADGELTMTYKGGDVCNHNGFSRTSVITFECNKTAVDSGKGAPAFVGETECTYFFEWQTKYACSDHPADTTCTLSHGSKRFDLSPLGRTKGDNWQALDGRHEHGSEDEHGQYFINICADLLVSETNTCPDGSAACFLNDVSTSPALNLGRYTQSPVFDVDGHITLNYTEGDICIEASGNQPEVRRSTILMFVCAPGDLESAPSLVRKSEDGCLYEFEWRTAAACPLGRKQGTDCKVFDDDAGFSFDLNPLTKKTGFYQPDSSNSTYNYYLNVCDKVRGTNCDEDNNPGACQDQKQGDGKWMIGKMNTTLEYYDGVLKLKYLNGDQYNTPAGGAVVNRETEIAFLCDPDIDIGEPEYQSEGDHTYFFKWHTKYACPEQPIECIVTDESTHEQYDLSSLSKALEEENWSFVDDATDPSSLKKYYINVCRPINPVTGCGSFASVCQTKFENDVEVNSIANLGIARSQPIVESTGHIMLKYVNGSSCSAGGKTRVESHVHFSCRKGKLGSSPRLLEKVNDCLYNFIWETEAACPINTIQHDNCVVKDPNSEYWFNLKPLMKLNGFYDVQTPDNRHFQLNICNGTGSTSQCTDPNSNTLTSACEVKGDTATNIGYNSTELQFSDDGLLTLKYNGPSDPNTLDVITTEITFLCRHNISHADQKPTFVRKEDYNYLFNFATPLACLPESVDCLVSDMHGNQYDLSPLAKDSGNWEAVDTRDGKEHLSYHINVCRPVNALSTQDGGQQVSETIQCPGGPIGACQTDSEKKASHNMGYVQAMPEAGTDGSLSIRYVNGDICHGTYHRSTRINFECSTTPGSPVFQDETLECEYIFTWQTPAACALKRVTGKDCIVQVQQYDFEFDLNPMHNDTNDYIITTPNFDYQINVCGPLVSGTGECQGDNVAACQKDKDGGVVAQAGKANQNIVYDEGVLSLNYTDGKRCHKGTYDRSTAINFFCDDTILVGNGQPVFINETADCTYMFEWATPAACPPFKVVECSYRDGQQQYDLAALANVEDNYKVMSNSGVERGVYYINMCRSLLHKKGVKGSGCPHNSAACLEMTDKDGQKRYKSLGEVRDGPVMENNHLVIRYQGGDLCPDGAKKMSTEISIECDKNGVGGLPQFSYASDECTYYFTWFSNLACDIADDNEAVNDDCTATNPATGHIFDLSSLSTPDGGGYQIKGKDGHRYTINICDKLTGSNCEGDGIGSCQEQTAALNPKHFNAGHYNRRLHYDDGIISLTYEDGAPCHNAKYSRSTVINFVCPLVEGQDGEPVFIDESDDCTYFMSWHTSLVCEHFIQCTVTNGSQTIDLSPLVNSQGYFLATSLGEADPTPFYINLCHPLNPIPGIRCPPGAAACKVAETGNPISLGKVDQGPHIGDDNMVTITYVNGDQCETDHTKNISSTVTLQCTKGLTASSPVMSSFNDCNYHFIWETNAVCPPSAPTKGTDCKYYNDVLDYEFDLSSLAGKVHKTSVPNYGQIMLSLCTEVEDGQGDCADAAVCKMDGDASKSLGSLASQQFTFEGHRLKVTYTDGSDCLNGGKRETTILFKCSEDGKEEEPAFFSVDQSCHYVYQWSTSLACPPMTMPCDLSYYGNIFDLQPLSQITGSWQFQDADKNTYYMNLCQPAYNTPDGCPKEAAVCRQRHDSTVDVLGMVYTQQLRAYGDHSKPDLIMKLSDGTPHACGGDTSVEVTSTEVQIIFKCAKKVGKPTFFNHTITDHKACRFSFLWESKVACPEERISVTEKHGKLVDMETDKVIDLNPLIEHGRWTVQGDERDESSGVHSTYNYHINLAPKTPSFDGDKKSKCKNAAVCQTKTEDGSFFRGIGNSDSKKYFIVGEIVEIEITSPQTCGQKDTRDVVSTIVLQCDPEGNLGQPKFLYESSNCQYYFEWVTSAACDSALAVSPNQPNSGSGGGDSVGSGKHNEASSVIGVLAGIVIVCVLVIVFHKKERRAAVYWRVRRCLPGAYSKVPTYSYAQLSSGDSEENLIGIGMNSAQGLFSEDEEDEELLKDTRPNPHEFHDDSDEEILPNV